MNTMLEMPVATKGKERTSLRSLAEAILLQALEDLWDGARRKETIAFFCGEGFRHCADIASMNNYERLKLIRIVRRAIMKTGGRRLPDLKRMSN